MKFKKYILVLRFWVLVLFVCQFPSASADESFAESDNKVLEKAIGHLIMYQTERQINGQAGLNSPLTEVFKTYYEDIEALPEDKRAMFMFMADNHLKVHGGAELFKFYDFVYLCCLNEYIQLVESNLSNRYFNSELIKRKFDMVRNLESRIKRQAVWRERSLEEHKEIMKVEFIEMIKVVNDSNYKIAD